MSSTLRTSRIAKGLLQRATASVLFLPVSLGLNVPLDASNRGLASQGPRALQWEQIEERRARKPPGFMLEVDSVLYDSPQQADQGSSPADSAKLLLIDGTPVRLKFARAVVSSRVIAGDKVPLEVVESVLVSNLTVIPQHSLAEATVTMAQTKRSRGRGGRLELKIENVRLADGQLVPVRAAKEEKSEGHQIAITAPMDAPKAAYWLFSTLDFDVKGYDAAIPAGTEITTYITGNFPLDASRFQNAVARPQQKDEPK
jgi:hypothetical protein